MRVCRAFIFFTTSILIGSAVAADATNLVPWFTMSNAWHSVSTNEVIRRASTGDAEAQCYLGKSYFEGLHGFPTNFAEGRQWLLKSAEQDVAQAQNTLGWNAANGIGMATNHAQAVYWYQKAADLGFAQSEMNLARTYRYGTGVPRDMSRALEWYRRSVDHGFRLAKRELGFILSDEPGFGPGERSEGVQLLREAANEGDATAQNRVGWSYWKGEGIKADESEAQRWFFAAARKGSIKAMDNLYALACEREDRVTLTNLFTIVADHAQRGVAPAQMLAGRMCSGGLGVAQDKREAMSWYEKAAAQDYGPALEAIGLYYHNSGPTQDRKKAYEYFRRAAAKGLKDSKGYIAELLLNGEAGITNEAAGIEALKAAAVSGSGNGIAIFLIHLGVGQWYCHISDSIPSRGRAIVLPYF